jgi:PAS domain S-box-containing protein
VRDDSDPRPTRPAQTYTAFDEPSDRLGVEHAADAFPGSPGMLFKQAMAQTRMSICLTDPHLPDNPIVFANRAFRELTGYRDDELIGRNCRFLQGPKTDPAPVAAMREALANEDVVIVEMLNYRKDGSTFWNALHLGPIYDETGKLAYFFGSQWDVTDLRVARAEEQHARMMARELSHRMKNMFAVISGIVNVTGRMRGVEREAAEINDRIQALGRAYETTLDDAASGTIEIGNAIHAILDPYGRKGAPLELRGNGARVPFSVVSIVGLVLHELAANATKYGAWASDTGSVTVDWNSPEPDETLVIEWRERGGPAIDPDAVAAGTGSAIVDRILRTASGTIERKWNPEGFEAIVSIPLRG